MLLSDWRDRTPHKDSMTAKVIAVIEPVLVAMGAAPDPTCWVVWGDDPAVRYVVLVPTDAGLLQVHVRVMVPQEGPRTSAKLIRWGRVQTGELAMEHAGGHRVLSFQVEGMVLRGSDGDADAIADFALRLFAAMDGRPPLPEATVRGGARKGSKSTAGQAGGPPRRPPSAGR